MRSHISQLATAKFSWKYHGVWKPQKMSHSTMRAKRATFTFWVNISWKCQKSFILASFWKPEACGQTVLPDRSLLIGQKLVENAKIKTFKCDILSNYQTMWTCFVYKKIEKILYFLGNSDITITYCTIIMKIRNVVELLRKIVIILSLTFTSHHTLIG